MAIFDVDVSSEERHVLRTVLALMRRQPNDPTVNAASITITADAAGCAITYQDFEDPSETFTAQGASFERAWAIIQNRITAEEALQGYLDSSRSAYRH
jgi:hypothetical protein